MYLRYSRRVTDAMRFDPHFANVLAYDIAVEVVEPLGKNTALKRQLIAEREMAIREAMRMGAIENNQTDDARTGQATEPSWVTKGR